MYVIAIAVSQDSVRGGMSIYIYSLIPWRVCVE